LVELNVYIDKLTNGDWKDNKNRDEKLRLCLHFRNAFLIQLSYFYVIIEPETKTVTGLISSNYTVFYFLNLKDVADFEKFKNETVDSKTDEYSYGIFIMKENSFGDELIKEYSKNLGYTYSMFVKLQDSQFTHLASRIRFQEAIFNLLFGNMIPASFEINDKINFLQNGKRFMAARYPENDEKRFENFAPIIEILLEKMNLKGKCGFPFWIIIEVNQKYTTPGYPNYDYPEDISFMTEGIYKLSEDGLGGYGFGTYCFIENDNLNFGVRVSIIAGEKLN